ncbi:MAG TPA: tripartite tricarboxylate transporter substrate binding protein [Burkholderiaceae bacterium]|nr:tripartite tricarboxylate transporter substrate binding protein [Burkholderiaceae bacterium]
MNYLIPWAAALALALAAAGAHGQPRSAVFPDKPVRIILPFAAGGATDVIARTVGQKLSERWGQAVVVDNRAGGNGNIGAATAAKAPADGYTLLMATSSHAINATLYKKLDYSLAQSFSALSNLASVPLVLVAHPGLPVTSPQSLATYASERPGVLNFGSGGVGTAAHLAGELFNAASGAQMKHIAYKGGAPAMNDLLGGQVQVMFANLPEALAHVRAGKLRALALTGETRHPQQPELPTFAETGFKGIEAKSWFGLFAPRGTPRPVVDQLGRDIAAAVADAQVQARLKELGAEPIGNQPAQFQAYVDSEIRRWGALVQQSGATAD